MPVLWWVELSLVPPMGRPISCSVFWYICVLSTLDSLSANRWVCVPVMLVFYFIFLFFFFFNLSFLLVFLNFILYLFIFIGVQLLNNVVLVSAVQQSEPVTCIFIFTPFLDFLPI